MGKFLLRLYKRGAMENKLLQQFLIPLLAVISLIYAVKTLGKQPVILLNEVCQGQCDLKEDSLEIGNFSFYFTEKPTINLLKISQKDDYEEQTFFFPQAELKEKKLKTIIEKLNKEYSQYNIYISMVNRPNCGVQVIVRYNSDNINLAYEECESINLKNGVMFRLYNKKIIEKVRLQKDKPVLTIACI